MDVALFPLDTIKTRYGDDRPAIHQARKYLTQLFGLPLQGFRPPRDSGRQAASVASTVGLRQRPQVLLQEVRQLL